MATTQPAPLSNGPKPVDELFAKADMVSLNRILMERGISAERIITILPVPPQTVGSVAPPQFRVLYRAS